MQQLFTSQHTGVGSRKKNKIIINKCCISYHRETEEKEKATFR